MLNLIKNADFLDIFCGLLLLGIACLIVGAIGCAIYSFVLEIRHLEYKQRELLKYENRRDYLDIGQDPIKERLLSEFKKKVKVPYPSQRLKDLAIQITEERIQLGKAKLAVRRLERKVLEDSQKYCGLKLWLASRLEEKDYTD